MPYNFDSVLHCREAEIYDITDMIELLRQLFSIERDFSFDAEKQRTGLQMLLHSDTCKVFVAEKQGHVVGMATLQILISTAEGGYCGLIEDVVVDKNHRREGIGSLLLETTTEWAENEGLKRVQLLADKANVPAMEFYRKYKWMLTDLICFRKIL